MIKIILSIFILGFLAGCSSFDEVKYSPRISPVSAEFLVNKEHFVACLDSNKQDVDRVLRRAAEADGVILYFHGGLSAREYVEDDLGPWLLKSIFQDQNLSLPENKNIYPIFVNYDAGIDLKTLKQFIIGLGVDAVSEKVQERLEQEINKASFPKSVIKSQNYALASRILLSDDKALLVDNQEMDEKFSRILKDDDKQSEIALTLAKDPILFEAASQAKYIIQIEASKKGIPNNKILTVPNPMNIVVRSLIRFAIKTNHQFEPTIIEEVLRELKLLDLDPAGFAQSHWKKVYNNGKSCWEDNRNGRYLIDGLLAIQEEKESNNKKYTINTLSHSAGSIPVGFLVNHMAYETEQQLDNIVMLVPAISQTAFRKTFILNKHVYKNLYNFVLDLDAEENDKLLWGAYPASLLYFVSGVAEQKGFGDKMLLLEQHLAKDRAPYKYSWYQWIFGECPETVWKFFDENPSSRIYYAREFTTNDRDADAASHKCTKLPWVSRDLAKRVLHIFTGKDESSFVLDFTEGYQCSKHE